MKALRFDGARAALEDVPVPDRPGEALVRILAAGVCNTDLEIVRGYAEFRGTLGHEFVGTVERAEDEGLVGARVVGEINCGCGRCYLCRGGDPRHCPNRTVLGIVGRDGAMAEHVSLPPGNLLRVPENVPTSHAVFAEPLAAACEILEQVAIAPGARVALVGDGKLGQLIGQVLTTTGARVTAFGRHAAKLELLASRGVETALSSDAVDGDGRARADLRAGYDVVVEASGAGTGLALAQQLVRPRGTIVLKSTIHGEVTFDATSLIVNEVTLVGSRCGRFEKALALLVSGGVSVERLISRRMPISAGAAVHDAAAEPGVLKVIVEMGGEEGRREEEGGRREEEPRTLPADH
jgi:threonine dehydrogenase-like Zn-dependent dehydrogenase